MILVQLWLRAFGFYQKLYFQTDWGEEFGGKSFTKLENLQKRYFSPLNIQLLRTRKYHWWVMVLKKSISLNS
ncbi:hypothetical protein B9J78_03890 [bacterium Unc6]|nr:hypothetical protein [bacterium Unc6]